MTIFLLWVFVLLLYFRGIFQKKYFTALKDAQRCCFFFFLSSYIGNVIGSPKNEFLNLLISAYLVF